MRSLVLSIDKPGGATPRLTAGTNAGGDPVPSDPGPGAPVPGAPAREDSDPAGPAGGSGPGPEPDPPGVPAPGDRGGLPFVAPDGDGLRWSFELDLVSALEAIGRPLRDWDGVDQEEDLAAETAALGFTDVPPEPADVSSEPDPSGAGADAPPARPGADHFAAVAGAPPPGLGAGLAGA